jgi:hypothetical protein
MNAALMTGKRTQWTAGTAAVLAGLLTVGGPLLLAEHYAQAGASEDPSGYHVAEQARRGACPDIRNSRTAFVAPRRSVENS